MHLRDALVGFANSVALIGKVGVQVIEPFVGDL
jgi:hypothetical protein